MVAMRMSVEHSLYSIKQSRQIFAVFIFVFRWFVAFGEVVSKVNKYFCTRGGCNLCDAPANLVDSSMDGDGLLFVPLLIQMIVYYVDSSMDGDSCKTLFFKYFWE